MLAKEVPGAARVTAKRVADLESALGDQVLLHRFAVIKDRSALKSGDIIIDNDILSMKRRYDLDQQEIPAGGGRWYKTQLCSSSSHGGRCFFAQAETGATPGFATGDNGNIKSLWKKYLGAPLRVKKRNKHNLLSPFEKKLKKRYC